MIEEWLMSQGYVRDRPDGDRLGKAWDQRSGCDFTTLLFNPIGDGMWDAQIRHHAGGSNPTMNIGRCESLEDVQMIHEAIRRTNGYPGPEDGASDSKSHLDIEGQLFEGEPLPVPS